MSKYLERQVDISQVINSQTNINIYNPNTLNVIGKRPNSNNLNSNPYINNGGLKIIGNGQNNGGVRRP